MPRSTVKFFNDDKGWGIILDPAGDPERDVFVHYSAIERNGRERRTLVIGEEVEYECTETHKGLQAKQVRRILSGERK